MSKLRSVSTSFWSDPFIEELSANEKLLFLYFITNEKTNMLGVYELSIKKISFETGVNKDVIEKALKSFEELGKIKYLNSHVVLLNFAKHQKYNSNMKISAIDVYNNLPNCLKVNDEIIDKANPSEGLERVLNRLGMVRKVEVEDETKDELEDEAKIEIKNSLLSEIKISDLENNEVQYFEIALAYRNLFIKNLQEKNAPTANQEKATYKNYVTPIRLMMTAEGVTKEQLTKVYKYLGSIEGEFWKSNILSTSKLREKFQQLLLKSQENGKSNNSTTKSDAEHKQSAVDAVNKLFGR